MKNFSLCVTSASQAVICYCSLVYLLAFLTVCHWHFCNCLSNSYRVLFDHPCTSSSQSKIACNSTSHQRHMLLNILAAKADGSEQHLSVTALELGTATLTSSSALFKCHVPGTFLQQLVPLLTEWHLMWKGQFSSLFFRQVLLSLSIPRALSKETEQTFTDLYSSVNISLCFIMASLAHLR